MVDTWQLNKSIIDEGIWCIKMEVGLIIFLFKIIHRQTQVKFSSKSSQVHNWEFRPSCSSAFYLISRNAVGKSNQRLLNNRVKRKVIEIEEPNRFRFFSWIFFILNLSLIECINKFKDLLTNKLIISIDIYNNVSRSTMLSNHEIFVFEHIKSLLICYYLWLLL